MLSGSGRFLAASVTQSRLQYVRRLYSLGVHVPRGMGFLQCAHGFSAISFFLMFLKYCLDTGAA
jgi:hypothetical protein